MYDASFPFFGGEYLIHAYGRLNSKTIFLRGDSTVQGGSWDVGNNFEQTLRRSLARRGVRAPIIVNRAIGGTTWAHIDFLDGLNSDVSALTICKTGLNDAVNGLALLEANMRSKLDALRSLQGGDFTRHPVLIVGPTVANDGPSGRDLAWVESVQSVYRRVAREKQCAYYDPSCIVSDAVVAAGIYMDAPFGDSRTVHPNGLMNALYINRFMDDVFPVSVVQAFTGSLQSLPLANGWSWLGGAYQPPMFSVSSCGILRLHGMIGGGNTSQFSKFAQLPAGYRPAHICQTMVLSQTAAVGINISTDGSITFQSAPSAISVSLDGAQLQLG